MRLVREGKWEELQDWVSAVGVLGKSQLVTDRDQLGMTLLMHCVERCSEPLHVEVIDHMLKSLSSGDARQEEFQQWLRVEDQYGRTAHTMWVDQVRARLKKPKEPQNLFSDYQPKLLAYSQSALHRTVSLGSDAEVRVALRFTKDAKVFNAQDLQGLTPIMQAAQSGSAKKVALMLERAADLSAVLDMHLVDREGRNVFDFAAGSLELTLLLEQHDSGEVAATRRLLMVKQLSGPHNPRHLQELSAREKKTYNRWKLMKASFGLRATKGMGSSNRLASAASVLLLQRRNATTDANSASQVDNSGDEQLYGTFDHPDARGERSSDVNASSPFSERIDTTSIGMSSLRGFGKGVAQTVQRLRANRTSEYTKF
jgi:hypothetical protein